MTIGLMDIQLLTNNYKRVIEAELSNLRGLQVEDINYLHPKETVAGKIHKLEQLWMSLHQEWYRLPNSLTRLFVHRYSCASIPENTWASCSRAGY